MIVYQPKDMEHVQFEISKSIIYNVKTNEEKPNVELQSNYQLILYKHQFRKQGYNSAIKRSIKQCDHFNVIYFGRKRCTLHFWRLQT